MEVFRTICKNRNAATDMSAKLLRDVGSRGLHQTIEKEVPYNNEAKLPKKIRKTFSKKREYAKYKFGEVVLFLTRT